MIFISYTIYLWIFMINYMYIVYLQYYILYSIDSILFTYICNIFIYNYNKL